VSSVVLRPIALSDAAALHAIFTEPGVRQYLFDDILLTRAETQGHVEAALGHDAWIVMLDGEVMGFTSLRPVGDDRELMIALSGRCWGRGVAFQASQAAMRHGFEVLKLDRILASVDLPNERSHRLMARLGFTPTGESQGPRYGLRSYQILPDREFPARS
jgi:ribosomal-protein-alanine N-acetyltransferase